jgi:hypothetical protein
MRRSDRIRSDVAAGTFSGRQAARRVGIGSAAPGRLLAADLHGTTDA